MFYGPGTDGFQDFFRNYDLIFLSYTLYTTVTVLQRVVPPFNCNCLILQENLPDMHNLLSRVLVGSETFGLPQLDCCRRFRGFSKTLGVEFHHVGILDRKKSDRIYKPKAYEQQAKRFMQESFHMRSMLVFMP